MTPRLIVNKLELGSYPHDTAGDLIIRRRGGRFNVGNARLFLKLFLLFCWRGRGFVFMEDLKSTIFIMAGIGGGFMICLGAAVARYTA